MLKAVMFDMGGTLEDISTDAVTTDKAVLGVRAILREAGMDPSVSDEAFKSALLAGFDRYNAYRDRTYYELKPEQIWGEYALSELGFTRESILLVAERIAHMWEITNFRRALRPHVEELLQGLKAQGLKLGIVSNTASLYQVFWQLEQYGIRQYFDDVTLSSVTGYRKPDPAAFQVSFLQLQVKANEAVYVGDTVSRDVTGARRAGFAAVIQIGSQLTRMKDAGLLNTPKPDAVISDIYEVLPLVEGWREDKEKRCVV